MAMTINWDDHGGTCAPLPGDSRRPVRLVTAATLVVLGIGVVLRAGLVRATEASLAAALVGAVTRTQTYVWRARGSFYWGVGSGETRGLRISGECSSAYVAGPLLVAFGLLLLLKRLPQSQLVVGVIAGIALMIAVNTTRIVLIAEAIHVWDSPAAFWWSHVVLGSIIAVIGNVLALALALKIAFRDRPRST